MEDALDVVAEMKEAFDKKNIYSDIAYMSSQMMNALIKQGFSREESIILMSNILAKGNK
jgi:hypothetical protein